MSPEQRTDQEIVRRILQGDRAAFVAFVERYERLVRHVVFRMVRDGRDREELCQDVFMKAHRHLARFRFEAKLSTWLARIAYTTALNHLEKKRLPLYADVAAPHEEAEPGRLNKLAQLPSEDVGPEAEAAALDVRALVHGALDGLPVAQRTALTLYHLEGMSVKEVGEVMGLPDGTVKSHLFRARKQLKDLLLAQYHPDDLKP